MVDLGTRKILDYLRLIATGLFISALTLLIVEGLASYALSFRDRRIIHVAAERERSTYDADLGWVNKPNIHIADMYGPGVYADGTGPAAEFRIRVRSGSNRAARRALSQSPKIQMPWSYRWGYLTCRFEAKTLLFRL